MSRLPYIENKKINVFFRGIPFEIYEQTANALGIGAGCIVMTWIDYCYLIKQDSQVGLNLMKQQFRMPLFRNFHIDKDQKQLKRSL